MTLPNKYKAAQEHLQATPEMRQRLLQAVRDAEIAPAEKPAIRFERRARRVAAFAACIVLAVAAFGIRRSLPSDDAVQPPLTPDSVQEALRFTLYAPSTLPDDYALTDFTATGNAVTLAYTCGDAVITYAMYESIAYPDDVGASVPDDPQIIPRGAEAVTFVTVGDWLVTLYGSKDAYLYADGYSDGKNFQFAFSAPLAEEDVLAVIASIKPCA